MVYIDDATKPLIVMVPSVPKQVVGLFEFALIVGTGLVVTKIVALGLSQPAAVF